MWKFNIAVGSKFANQLPQIMMKIFSGILFFLNHKFIWKQPPVSPLAQICSLQLFLSTLNLRSFSRLFSDFITVKKRFIFITGFMREIKESWKEIYMNYTMLHIICSIVQESVTEFYNKIMIIDNVELLEKMWRNFNCNFIT